MNKYYHTKSEFIRNPEALDESPKAKRRRRGNLFRRVPFFTAVFLLVVFFWVPRPYSGNAEENATVRVSAFRIKGLKDISVGTVKKSIVTQSPSKRPWKKKPEFSRQIFEDDIERIEQLLHDHGYYDSSVEHELIFREENQLVDIEVTVNQGDPMVVRTLTVNILSSEPNDYADIIKKKIPLAEGKPFSRIKYQKSKDVIREILSERGYSQPELVSEAVVNLVDKKVNVNFMVDPGLKYFFGDVSFSGNSNIETRLIEREIEYEKGDLFSLEKTEKSRVNIFRTGFFNSVIMDVDYDEEALEVDTNYRVTESKLGSLKFGVGYATEEMLRTQFFWNQRNFLGGGKTLQVNLGYSSLSLGLWTKLDRPHVLGRNSNLSIQVDLKDENFPAYEGVSTNLNSTLSKELWDVFTVYASAALVYSRIDSQVEETLFEESDNNVFLTLLDFAIDYDGTDSLINPTRGSRVFFFLETPVKIASSDDINYLKSQAEFKYYRKILDFVIATHLSIGNISSLGDTDIGEVPVFKRIFAGGSASMRGFSFQQLGPLNSSGDPIGGNSMLIGSFELRFPYFSNLGVVTFLDYGNVYENSLGFDASDIKYAAGAGIRYNTVVGPLRLDFGYLLNPEGKERDERLKIFVSIGHAF